MKSVSVILSFLTIFFLLFGTADAKGKSSKICAEGYYNKETLQCEKFEPGAEEEKERDAEENYEWEEEWTPTKDYRRLHYSFGFAGSYWARQDGTKIDGTFGAYTGFEYRFSKIAGAGFDLFYGYLAGEGTSYWSAFNPGIKIYPMAYRNPRFEPFFFIGGHAFDGAFGDSNRGNVGVGQGPFLGVGFRYYWNEDSRFGIEWFVRASALWMQRPGPATGRGLAIPITGVFAFTY